MKKKMGEGVDVLQRKKESALFKRDHTLDGESLDLRWSRPRCLAQLKIDH